MLPKTYKKLLKVLIEIAEHGTDYKPALERKDELEIGNVVAEIQNWLGENRDLLDKFNLNYNSGFD